MRRSSSHPSRPRGQFVWVSASREHEESGVAMDEKLAMMRVTLNPFGTVRVHALLGGIAEPVEEEERDVSVVWGRTIQNSSALFSFEDEIGGEASQIPVAKHRFPSNDENL